LEIKTWKYNHFNIIEIGTIFYTEQFNIPWLTCTSIICNGETFEDENVKCLANYSLHIDSGEMTNFIQCKFQK